MPIKNLNLKNAHCILVIYKIWKIAIYKLQIANEELEIVNCQLEIANCRFEKGNCQLPIANCKLQNANCKLQITNCKLQITNCKLQIYNSTIQQEMGNVSFLIQQINSVLNSYIKNFKLLPVENLQFNNSTENGAC